MYRILIIILLTLASGRLMAADSSLWQQGVALTAEHILTRDYQEVVIEQSVPVYAAGNEVWNILADLKHYPSFYSLFDKLDVHQDYYRDDTHISEFTAWHLQQAGRFVIEEPFYGIVEADSERRSLVIKLWQLDAAYIHVHIQLHNSSPEHSLLTITTRLYAEPDALQRISHRELDQPLFKAQAFKYLLEEGVTLPQCLVSPASNRFCL